ncbi:hypothetical protein JYU34_006939 [Plutella xylostella]|uniref:SCP domain-containing protein n=1 Tax=Plutella xylostella TaxID=51655 RepID=A0ABQ7QT73_PLUXY|nr:hypothetical protein JYU34_006939 [Plutella xylostella]
MVASVLTMHFSLAFLLTVLTAAQCKLIKLSCDETRQLVDGHNVRRMRIANGTLSGYPGATNMKFMVWDKELAHKAGLWAERNVFMHNPNRTINSKRFETGENIYMYQTTARRASFSMEMALKSWWDEYRDWKYGPMTEEDFAEGSEDIGHFTQMAWADSSYLGCGLFVSRTQDKRSTKFFIVCNYGPGGNIIGSSPYRAGEPTKRLYCVTGNCGRPYGRHC